MATEPIQIPDATAEPAAYKQALLDLIGDTDPLATLGATVEKWRAVTRGLSAEQLTTEPVEGEWSVAQITGHLFDVDLVYGFRWRLLLTEENPSYPGYDEKLWTPMPRLPFPQLLDAWAGLRAANMLVLEANWPAAAQRSANHSEQGPETLDETVRKIAAHDLAHLNQLQRAAEATA
jgi:uncharacterized damage-inducible protein DinB